MITTRAMAAALQNFAMCLMVNLSDPLFGLFEMLTLTKWHAGTASVFADEFDAGSFQGVSHNNQRMRRARVIWVRAKMGSHTPGPP